jgi:hypothetical protein
MTIYWRAIEGLETTAWHSWKQTVVMFFYYYKDIFLREAWIRLVQLNARNGAIHRLEEYFGIQGPAHTTVCIVACTLHPHPHTLHSYLVRRASISYVPPTPYLLPHTYSLHTFHLISLTFFRLLPCTSYFLPRFSYLLYLTCRPSTSYLVPHTSYIPPHTSHLIYLTFLHLVPRTSYLPPFSSYVLYLTCHTSHLVFLTYSTSHVIPSTSFLVPHTIHLVARSSYIPTS